MGSPPAGRPDAPHWMRPISERLSPAIRLLVILNSLLFAFYVLVPRSQGFFRSHVALSPAILRGEFWQPLTSLFVHLDFLSFLFNVIGLWFVGAAIERAVGRRKFYLVFFGPAVAANVVMFLVSMSLGTGELFAGCNMAILGLFVAFGRIFDTTPARIFGGLVLQAKTLAAILVVFSLLADLTRGSWSNVVGDVVVVLLAYAIVGGRGEGLRQMWNQWRARQVRKRYQVLEGGRGRGRPSSRYLN